MVGNKTRKLLPAHLTKVAGTMIMTADVLYGGAVPPTCSTIGVQRSNAVRRKRSMCSLPEARSEEEGFFLANSEQLVDRSLADSKPLFKRPLFSGTAERRGSMYSLRTSTKSQAGRKRAYSSPVSIDTRRWARYLEIANSTPKSEEYWLELGAKLEAEHRAPVAIPVMEANEDPPFLPLVPTKGVGLPLSEETEVGGDSNCWQCLFQYDLGENVTIPLSMIQMTMAADPDEVPGRRCTCGCDPDAPWKIQLKVSFNGKVLHFADPIFHPMRPEKTALYEGGPPLPEYQLREGNIWLADVLAAVDPTTDVGLTTAVVLGTIGDVEPTLDVVASNHFAAVSASANTDGYEQRYVFTETGSGWCATDFMEVCLPFAKSLDEHFGSLKGLLRVHASLWNEICSAWGGTQKHVELVGEGLPGSFLEEEVSTLYDVPARSVGPHKRVYPEDFVLVTHPDHIAKLAPSWGGQAVETRALSVTSSDFIRLGQDILTKGVYALKDIKSMQQELLLAIKSTMPFVEQSDLIYLVSGTTFHYFIGSLFPDKQVYEVCPVPREDNGVCPEFYLGHYAEYFSSNPSFGHQLGRVYNQWLMTPQSLKTIEWEGEFKYREPPKFHSIMPWAQETWKIQSANVGFKPFDDVVKKTRYVEGERIKAYFSLGSCESVTKETQPLIRWLRSLNVDWHCDPRWVHLFEGCSATSAGFFPHTTGLAEFDWVVHHGGSGTTNTCLAVGVPQTILPQIGDQFIWHKTLRKHQIPVCVEEGIVRAHLFSQRLPPVPDESVDVIDRHKCWIKQANATLVRPFWLSLSCCHDWNQYGYKLLDLVIAHTDEVWVTLFDTSYQRTGVPGEPQLKWVAKECKLSVSPIPGWHGTRVNATYPRHAHGWLGYDVPNEGIDASVEVDEGLLREMADLSRTTKDRSQPTESQRPAVGECPKCNRTRELCFGICSRCLGEACVAHASGGPRPDLRAPVYWSKARRKAPDKSKTGGVHFSGTAVRSQRRYFQLDTRMLDNAPVRSVARALLDRVKDWSDTKWIEAYWAYTNSWPPHYQPQTNTEDAIAEMLDLYGSVQIQGLAEDVVAALGSVLSVSSNYSLCKRLLSLNMLTGVGRGVARAKWHVLVDALRHFSDFAAKLNIRVMPKFIESALPELPLANCTSLVSWKRGLATPLRTRAASSRWMEEVNSSGSRLMVHFFSQKLPALGHAFGVFHAVVQFDGQFYELQQVAGEITHINDTRWQPEATPERPLVKTVVVSDDVVGAFDLRRIRREFGGLDYKVLGDNCLVFANFVVYSLTGKVIPWRHFGVFGQDITTEVTTLARKWVTSYVFTDEQERRVSIETMKFSCQDVFGKSKKVLARHKTYAGPPRAVKDYGLDALRRVDATIAAYNQLESEDESWSSDMLIELAILGYKRFGLSSHIVSQALFKVRMNNMPQRRRRVNLMIALGSTLRKLHTTRLVGDIQDVINQSSKLRMPLRLTRKPAWAPLVNISVPRHWFKDKERLVEVKHDPENLTVGNKKIVRLDLPQIAQRYEHYFEGVKFPDLGFRFIRPGEYEIGVKVPLRKGLPKMDKLTQDLVDDLQKMHPFELGVFSLRFGTEEMAEKVTDRYFTGTFDAGKLIPEHEQEELAEAIFQNNHKRYANAQLLNPEEVWRKWHKNYSAGFPFRFNEKGNAKRQALIDAAGGREAFLAAVRKYIASPEAFPTVSHAFIKDEVLPKSYIEREKIRTIIAQDPLNYYAEMAVSGFHAKQMDPTSFSAVGVSPAHGELSALAEKHLAYKHHFAMDVTALDSTAAIDAIETIKKLRCKGFQNHPQRDNIYSMIDACYSNLQSSWIIDIHTGRARFKKQGFTTGHANTTGDNTDYMHVMMLYAWHKTTGRPYSEFYDEVKFSSFSDDNFWSTNLDKSVFSAKTISDFWLSRGVQVRIEGESDDLSNLSFLAKRFSFDPAHLEEVRRYAKRDAKVAIVHDTERLLQKFSDYKKKNTLGYRWEKLVALQSNCAHHRDIYDKVSEYLDALERNMTRRQFMRKFMRQHPRKSYEDVMELMYSPKNNKSGLIVSSIEDTLSHRIQLWWDTMRVDIMAYDGAVNSYSRVLQQFTGLLEIGGLNVEDPGVFLRQPGEMPTDKEFTLEHHAYLLNGCPASFEQFRSIIQKTPFAAFCNAEGFWATRERFDVSESTANGLRAKVLLLQAIYTIVAWLERSLCTVPVIGPMYKFFCTAKGMTEVMYSRLNALYYMAFGDSSLVLSSMMPKDRYISLKVLAFRVWTSFTSTDLLDFAGDIDQFKGMADAVAKLAQDVSNLVFDLDFSSVVPNPNNGESSNTGVESGWTALDHSHSVKTCLDLIGERKEPLVTGPTGCGKSTDFIVGLAKEFTTVLVACPRRVLVKGSPVAQRRLYAGSTDHLTPGLINFGTAGYFRQILSELPQDSILVLDEFHEMDEDTLWLKETFKHKTICVSATPDFPCSERFSQVRLTASRNAGWVVETEVRDTRAKLEDAWEALITDGLHKKTLVIVPTIRMVQELTRHTTKLASNKRVCELYRGHDRVDSADWYFATSIVDSGITIPNLEMVIDLGWSSGWSSGSFETRPSSHNTMDQRKGRTGRTCDGSYLRLMAAFNDTPWDFTTPFYFNCWEVVSAWLPSAGRPPDRRKGCLGGLPAGYDSLLADSNWSVLIYLTFFYQNRGDVNKTRAAYQAGKKFPDSADVVYVVGQHQNKVFQDLHVVESFLRKYRIDNTGGNVWAPMGTNVYLETFREPVPSHLQDVDY
uniref:Polyprotein n=1 Tax=Alternaria dianthicola hypovirus 1 TaxID=2992029 RepID=A0A9E8ADR8_9VIRU|nr:polyprotein [Alternaria dianthicola hypovirus 1]